MAVPYASCPLRDSSIKYCCSPVQLLSCITTANAYTESFSEWRCRSRLRITYLRCSAEFSRCTDPGTPGLSSGITDYPRTPRPRRTERSTRRWDGNVRNPGKKSRQNVLHTADTRLGSETYRKPRRTARISRNFPGVARLCTRGRRLPRDAEFSPAASVLARAATRSSNSSAEIPRSLPAIPTASTTPVPEIR